MLPMQQAFVASSQKLCDFHYSMKQIAFFAFLPAFNLGKSHFRLLYCVTSV